MSYGVRVAKKNKDVDSFNTDDLYINSDNPILKLYKSGGGSQVFQGNAGESYTIQIDHNLGYIPFFLIFMDRIPQGARRLVTSRENTNSATSWGNTISCLMFSVSTNNFIFKVQGFGGTPPPGKYDYSYFIYYDKLGGDRGV